MGMVRMVRLFSGDDAKKSTALDLTLGRMNEMFTGVFETLVICGCSMTLPVTLEVQCVLPWVTNQYSPRQLAKRP